MNKQRRLRLQAVLLEEISSLVPREIKDPRIPKLTFTGVEITEDGSLATVFIALFGIQTQDSTYQMQNCLTGLTSATGYIKRCLGKELNLRHMPHIIFKEDKGLENAFRIQELLGEMSKETS